MHTGHSLLPACAHQAPGVGHADHAGLSHLQVTALQIASLKKVSRRTQILLLDKTGGTSKVIAKELSRKGFKRVRVIQVSPTLRLLSVLV